MTLGLSLKKIFEPHFSHCNPNALTFLMGSLHLAHLYMRHHRRIHSSTTWTVAFFILGLYAPAANLSPQRLHSHIPALTLRTDAWWQTGHSCFDRW